MALSCLATACERRHILRREELRSDLTSAISVVNEMELSMEFVLRGQATHTFAAGHFRYLAEQLRDVSKDLAGTTPERGLEQVQKDSRAQMDALSGVLARIESEANQAEALRAAEQRVRGIRAALEQEKSAL